MAYMRGDPYVYDTEHSVEIHAGTAHVSLPHDTFDALAIMRAAEIAHEPARCARVLRLVVEQYSGHYGADSVMAMMGAPTAMDWLRTLLTQNAPDDRS